MNRRMEYRPPDPVAGIVRDNRDVVLRYLLIQTDTGVVEQWWEQDGSLLFQRLPEPEGEAVVEDDEEDEGSRLAEK